MVEELYDEEVKCRDFSKYIQTFALINLNPNKNPIVFIHILKN